MSDLEFETINGLEATTPAFLDETSSVYDKNRVHITDEYFYLVDNKDVYMQGCLQMKPISFDQIFSFILWVRFPAKSFVEMSENINADRKESTLTAELVSDIPFYNDMIGTKVLLSFDTKDSIKKPTIIPMNNDSEIHNDYQDGINKEKYLKWQKELGAF